MISSLQCYVLIRAYLEFMCPCELVYNIHLRCSPQLRPSNILTCEVVPYDYLHVHTVILISITCCIILYLVIVGITHQLSENLNSFTLYFSSLYSSFMGTTVTGWPLWLTLIQGQTLQGVLDSRMSLQGIPSCSLQLAASGTWHRSPLEESHQPQWMNEGVAVCCHPQLKLKLRRFLIYSQAWCHIQHWMVVWQGHQLVDVFTWQIVQSSNSIMMDVTTTVVSATWASQYIPYVCPGRNWRLGKKLFFGINRSSRVHGDRVSSHVDPYLTSYVVSNTTRYHAPKQIIEFMMQRERRCVIKQCNTKRTISAWTEKENNLRIPKEGKVNEIIIDK